jgi:hypothetical protein
MIFWSVLAFAFTSVAVVFLYRFVPPPGTPLMLLRKFDDRYTGRVRKRWVPLRRVCAIWSAPSSPRRMPASASTTASISMPSKRR